MATVLSIVLSIAALIFSMYVFIDSRVRDRRDLLIKMHEILISDDLQRGRHLLFTKVTDEASVDGLTDEEYRNINRVISVFSLLGIYVEKGYVSAQDVIDAWGWSIYRSWVAAQPFIAHREQHNGQRPGKYLGLLAQRVRRSLDKGGAQAEDESGQGEGPFSRPGEQQLTTENETTLPQ